MSEIVQVSKLPSCNFHENCVATYDFRTRMGPWANGCFDAYMANRADATLGTGKGQLLTTEPVVKGPVPLPTHRAPTDNEIIADYLGIDPDDVDTYDGDLF